MKLRSQDGFAMIFGIIVVVIVIGAVSTHGSEHHPGFGIVEIGLFHLLNNEPAHWCPFVHFDDSIKDEMNKKILAFY